MSGVRAGLARFAHVVNLLLSSRRLLHTLAALSQVPLPFPAALHIQQRSATASRCPYAYLLESCIAVKCPPCSRQHRSRVTEIRCGNRKLVGYLFTAILQDARARPGLSMEA
ncbi:hypothetical protein BC834DRAFT_863716 [Gloeopeniophorella convolvens]|nr:hypothetical protein BC834DRAFT_863716 [Gloeopeniophorella convolvens]